MYNELLLALLGHPGDIFVDHGGSIKVARGLPYMDASEEARLNRLCELGSMFQRLDAYANLHTTDLYLRCVRLSLLDAIQPYCDAVLEFEEKVAAHPHVPVAQLFLVLDPYTLLLPALCELVDEIDGSQARGAAVLSILASRARSGTIVIRTSIAGMLAAGQRLFTSHALAWMLHAHLPPAGLFPIARAQSDGELSLEQTWHLYHVADALRPSYISPRVADDMLFIGRAVLVCQATPSARRALAPAAEEHFAARIAAVTDPSHDPRPLEAAISDLRGTVSQSLMGLLHGQADIGLAFRTLKDFYLVSLGELFLGFLDAAAPILVAKPGMTTAQDLQAALTRAASSVHIEHSEAFQRFRISYDESITGTNTLSCVCLTYAVAWPLQLVLSDDAFARYNRLFRFLLYTKSVQMALNDMWLSMTHRKDTATMASLSALASLRARMSFFVNHFQDYLQADVLEAEFDALQARIRSVTDIRVLAAAHDEYLTALETKTMLGQPKVRQLVAAIFAGCERLCAAARRHAQPEQVPGHEIAAIQTTFDAQTRFLLLGLREVRHRHLSPLLLRIDFSGYFSRQLAAEEYVAAQEVITTTTTTTTLDDQAD
eukprot:m.68639 g.68639  ORF g.68639 m.68639 type:complete len:601 (+) comp7509_c0_seq3:49-1851(+)